jgi:hypothetical protein
LKSTTGREPMTAAQATMSAKPTWRYKDDLPPVSPPSRKRRLGAVLAYLVGTAGVGSAIFWPQGNQTLAFSAFTIPPNPFTATVAAIPPQPGPPPVTTSKQPTVATKRAPSKPNARLRPAQSTQNPRPVSSASQSTPVAVVTPNPTNAQQSPTTWVPPRTEPQSAANSTAPNKQETQPQRFDTKRRSRSHFRDNQATQPQPSSTPQTAPDTATAQPPNTTQNQG